MQCYSSIPVAENPKQITTAAVITALEKRFSLAPIEDCYEATSKASGAVCLINVRWKTKPVWSRTLRRWEYGISLLRFNHYQELAQQIPLFLIVAEKESGKVYWSNLLKLAPLGRAYEGDNAPDEGGSWFFPKEAMVPFTI